MSGIKSNSGTAKRNLSIDGWRGIMALLIVAFHLDEPYGFHHFFTGYLAVEFFFILSGFLLMKHLCSTPIDQIDLAVTPKKIFLSKFKRFFLLNFLCVLILHTWYFFQGGNQTILTYLSTSLDRIGEIFFLQSSGLPLNLVNWPAWYLSSLLFGSYIISALYCINQKIFQCLAAPMLAMAIYAYILQSKGFLGIWQITIASFTNYGFIRGVAGLCLGCILYSVYNKIVLMKGNRGLLPQKQEMFFNAVDLLNLAVMAKLLIYRTPSINDVWVLPCFCIAIMFSFLNLGVASKILKLKPFVFLGKISFEMFICHWFLLQIVKKYFLQISFFITLLAFLAIVICYSILFAYGIEPLLRKIGHSIWNCFNSPPKKTDPK